jgi:hypothetical protein
MPSDGDIQCDDVAVLRIGDSRFVTPVNQAVRHVKQQIGNGRLPVRLTADQSCDQFGDLRTDPGKRGDGSKQRIKDRGRMEGVVPLSDSGEAGGICSAMKIGHQCNNWNIL